jgi:proline racemase
MMQINQSIFVVDVHTTGTPTRVITSGIPTLHGANITAKMNIMKQSYDWLRSCTMQQPRGFQSLVGAVLTEPCVPEADFGLFYIDSLGYQPMCGSGTFAVAKVVAETGMVTIVEPITKVVFETPAGLVTVFVEIQQGIVKRIILENIPAFLYRRDVKLEISEIGTITVDIGFGGNFFTLVDVAQIGFGIAACNIQRMKDLSQKILFAANQVIKVQHPLNPAINYMEQLLYCQNTPEADGGYLAQCIFGDAQVDISPCGTGTSTRLSQRYAKGLIGLNESFVQKSFSGGAFCGTVIREEKVVEYDAVVSRLSCSDVHITGFNHLVVEANDKLKNGFVSW